MDIVPNKKDKFLRITILVTLLLVAGVLIYATASYAFWQKEHELEKENLLSSGCFSFKLTDKDSINLADAYPMSESDAMKLTPYNFTIENNCSIDMHYSITLNTTGSSDLDSSIRYKLIDSDDNVIGTDIISNLSTYKEYNNYTYTDDNGDFNILNSYVLGSDSLKAAVMNEDNTQVVTAGESKTYNLYLWLDESVDATETMNKSFEAKVLITSKAVEDASINQNIISAYTYNQDSTAANYCVTGDETTCVKTTCYKDSTSGSCPSGTIISYKVNESDVVRFHVMYDNGDIITMQTQKNTVYNVPWINADDYAAANTDGTSCGYASCNDEGPITILNVLEGATSGWSNVNQQTYMMGTTAFKNNAYTGCSSYSSCETNTYTLDERTAKARMITTQESADLGCTATNSSCPIWMYNYLYNSTSYGGTIDDTTTENGASYNYGYWTMSAYSTAVYFARYVYSYGSLNGNYTSGINLGARAVVEINK